MSLRRSFAAYLLTASAALAAPPLSATLEPQQIALGDSAQLTITSSGSGLEALTLPTVPGLTFRVVGQSRRMEMINGATLSTSSVIVRVVPQVAGIFSIPGITAQPLLLRVNPENSNSGSLPYGSSRANRRPPVVAGGTTVEGMRLTADGAAYVRMNLPKREVYVGESIPVDIEVGLRSGVVTSLNGLPTLTGSDFTLNNLSHQPERTEKLIDGQPFTLLTWHSMLAPVKPGSFTMAVETPVTVRVRTRPQRDATMDDLLGDPFLQNFFGATVPKDISVTSPSAELKVLPLPAEGRPKDFSGAVGSFKIADELSAPRAAVGDPLTLRLKITGSGNFDRVDSRMLEQLDRWKTYPPKSKFTAADAVGFKGEKTFEQPLIAAQPGEQTLPPVTFNYFDPATRRYEIARSTPLQVTIAASPGDNTAAAALTANGGPPPPSAPPADPALRALRADHPETASTARSLLPLYFEPAFLAVPSVLALLFAGGWVGRRRANSGARSVAVSRRRRLQATAHVLRQISQAADAGQSAQFFAHARAALQQDLGVRWQMPPQDITAAEIDARLGADGDGLRQIFALADEANYAGRPEGAPDYQRWMRLLRDQLNAQRPS